ncbi:uncharacterized protein LOC142364201 [Opisthocomus hoazin]|uniref:uncharacterized protein LOC142364201 n=1 Tax=Opisthocomus hoazin TaxID=30419 RepID=UPI003F53B906
MVPGSASAALCERGPARHGALLPRLCAASSIRAFIAGRGDSHRCGNSDDCFIVLITTRKARELGAPSRCPHLAAHPRGFPGAGGQRARGPAWPVPRATRSLAGHRARGWWLPQAPGSSPSPARVAIASCPGPGVRAGTGAVTFTVGGPRGGGRGPGSTACSALRPCERTLAAEPVHGFSWEKPLAPTLPLPSPEPREARALPEREPERLQHRPVPRHGAAVSAGLELLDLAPGTVLPRFCLVAWPPFLPVGPDQGTLGPFPARKRARPGWPCVPVPDAAAPRRWLGSRRPCPAPGTPGWPRSQDRLCPSLWGSPTLDAQPLAAGPAWARREIPRFPQQRSPAGPRCWRDPPEVATWPLSPWLVSVGGHKEGPP